MSSKAEIIRQCVKVYCSLVQNPALNHAQVLTGGPNSELIKISSKWSQRNLEKGEISKFQRYHLFKPPNFDLVFQSLPADISSEQLSSYSPSEKYRCVVREVKQDNKKKQFLEVWNENGLYKNFDVNAFDVHGDIYTDGEFGSLEWSLSEDKIAYIAEKKIKKSDPFYKQKSCDGDGKETIVGEEYTYRPDWGEQLVGKHQPVVGICDLKTETLKVLDGIPENVSLGQLIWSKDGFGVYGIALENEPRRLGLIYCSNRPSYIFHLTLDGKFKNLSGSDTAVRSPRLSLDGKFLFWLQRTPAGGHGGCSELVKLDLVTNKKLTIINIVKTLGKTFSGLYMPSLPRRCFSKDGTKLYFSTYQKTRVLSYFFDLTGKDAQPVPLDTGEGSSTILDVHNDIILTSCGSLQCSPSLKMSKSLTKVEWIPVTKSEVIIKNSVLKEMEFESKEPKQSVTYYNGIYYGPPTPTVAGQKIPLIVYPHGGPHSVFPNDFSIEANFFVSIGYGVLMVNYRGSIGAGQDAVEFLEGKISDTDVKDNHEAVLSVLKNFPYLDAKNIFLYGKSHGGYLVEELSAQYGPTDFYRAVVALNPVIDVKAMYSMSDIPDWATTESGLKFNEAKPLSVGDVTKMYCVSPISKADQIKAPTLFLIGRNDLRVPFYEGIKMYNALKARKIKTRLNLYDDNHTLGSVPNHIDCTINSALWFYENRAK